MSQTTVETMDILEKAKNTLDAPLEDLLRDYWWIAVPAGLILLLLLYAILERTGRLIFGRRKTASNQGDRLRENLADYPPPTGSPGPRRLLIEGWPARIRLVVIAPVGKENPIAVSDVAPILDQMFRGLGEVLKNDQPLIRIWPPQLSSQGFAPTFHRLVHKPEPEGQPSHWVLVAGQTPSRPRPLLLGLALWADEANTLGRLTLEPGQWLGVLSVRSQ